LIYSKLAGNAARDNKLQLAIRNDEDLHGVTIAHGSVSNDEEGQDCSNEAIEKV
jgi:hypothetical protein